MRQRMLYRQYKQSYADCGTVPGTYDKESKTIVVEIPEGRMKPSGTRGQTYKYFRIKATYEGKEIEIPVKAISYENALKQIKRKYIDEVIVIG